MRHEVSGRFGGGSVGGGYAHGKGRAPANRTAKSVGFGATIADCGGALRHDVEQLRRTFAWTRVHARRVDRPGASDPSARVWPWRNAHEMPGVAGRTCETGSWIISRSCDGPRPDLDPQGDAAQVRTEVACRRPGRSWRSERSSDYDAPGLANLSAKLRR